jgi:hypothetical protein
MNSSENKILEQDFSSANIKIGDKFLFQNGDVMYIKDFESSNIIIAEHSKEPNKNVKILLSKLEDRIKNNRLIKLPNSFKGFDLKNFTLDSILWDTKLEIFWKITEITTREFVMLRLQNQKTLERKKYICLNSKTISRFRCSRDSKSIISKLYEHCRNVFINDIILAYLCDEDISTLSLFSHLTCKELETNKILKNISINNFQEQFKLDSSEFEDIVIFKPKTYQFQMKNFRFKNFKLTPLEMCSVTLTKKQKDGSWYCVHSVDLTATKPIYFKYNLISIWDRPLLGDHNSPDVEYREIIDLDDIIFMELGFRQPYFCSRFKFEVCY